MDRFLRPIQKHGYQNKKLQMDQKTCGRLLQPDPRPKLSLHNVRERNKTSGFLSLRFGNTIKHIGVRTRFGQPFEITIKLMFFSAQWSETQKFNDGELVYQKIPQTKTMLIL